MKLKLPLLLLLLLMLLLLLELLLLLSLLLLPVSDWKAGIESIDAGIFEGRILEHSWPCTVDLRSSGRKRGYSFVFVDRPAAYLNADTVLVDNQGGIATCLDELLRQNCKKIAIIADTLSIWTASERIEGFKKACLSRGLDKRDIHVVTGIHTTDEARAATHSLLGSMPHIDGIIATNDLIAMGVGEVLHNEESTMKVVSFDDFPSADLFSIKSLDHDPQRLGKLSAEVLLKRIKNPTESKFFTEIMKLDLRENRTHSHQAVANG